MVLNEKPNPIANLLQSRGSHGLRHRTLTVSYYQKTSFLLIFIMFYKWNNSLMIEIRRRKKTVLFDTENQFSFSILETEITTLIGREVPYLWMERTIISETDRSAGPSESATDQRLERPHSQHLTDALNRLFFISLTDKKFVVLLYEIYISWHSWLSDQIPSQRSLSSQTKTLLFIIQI